MSVQLEKKMKGHTWQVSSVSFHPSSSVLASASWDRTVRIWDAKDFREISVFDRNVHTAPITCLAWHPNGNILATGSADNTTCLWDVGSATRVKTLREHFGWVLGCNFAPDRTMLATASWDRTVRLWDPNTGELLSTLRGHTKAVWTCKFYPVGHTSALLASAGEDSTCRLWDTRSRKVALTLSGAHLDSIYCLDWSNDGTMIATGSVDKSVALWDPKAGKALKVLQGHTDTVKSLHFMPNEKTLSHILASAGGYSAILWHTKTNISPLMAEITPHEVGREVEAVGISPDGKLLATGGRDGLVCISSIPFFPKEDGDRILQQRKAAAAPKPAEEPARKIEKPVALKPVVDPKKAKDQKQVQSPPPPQPEPSQQKKPPLKPIDRTRRDETPALKQVDRPQDKPQPHPMLKIYQKEEAQAGKKPPGPTPRSKLTDAELKQLMARQQAEDEAFAITSTDYRPPPPQARVDKTETELVSSLMESTHYADRKAVLKEPKAGVDTSSADVQQTIRGLSQQAPVSTNKGPVLPKVAMPKPLSVTTAKKTKF